MRTLSLFGVVLGTALTATAQVQQTLVPLQPPTAPVAPCGTDALHQHELEHNPAYLEAMQRFENDALQLDGTFQRDINTYKIPVVVHVMETGNDLTRITDAQIRDAMRAMNERFRKVAGTAGFGAGVDVGMEFVLAVRDPQGNCTNGITRRDMTGNATYMASGVFRQSAGITDASLKDVVRWDPSRYYNIWAVSEIDNNNGGDGIQGYAFFAGAHGMSMDGCVMLVNALRDPSDVTMTHELGHAMNVYHTFEGDGTGSTCPGNANCNNDGDLVCDTPPHRRSQSDCNSGGTNSCDGNSSNTLFVNNYMDYSNCANMFTAGQAARMVLALTTTRSSFLAANGNLSLVPAEAPVMDILPSRSVLCGTGQSVRLFTNATCTPNTWLSDSEFPGQSFSWTFTNGVSTYNSTAQNPTFTPATSGTYNATLSMTNALGTFTHTEQGVVIVSPAPVSACTPTSSNAGNFAQTVHTVSFNTINNSTSSVFNVPYTDFSCTQNTVVTRGGTYPLSVGIRAGGSAAQSVNAYIDYNNNGVFEDPSELVLSGSTPTNSTTTLTANVTIPMTAVNNTFLRMRVYGEAGTLSSTERTCGAAFFAGDVEDYGVYVSGNLAAVSIAAAPGNTITYGTNVTFTPTATNGGGAPTYQWFLNGDQVGTGTTYSNNTLLPGDQVYCRLFSNLAGVVASPATSNTVSMVVTGPPRSEFVASTERLCSGGQVSFTDQSLLSPTSWSWSFPGGTPTSSTAQNPTVTYSTPGTYSVTLIASNGFGTGTTRTRTAYINVLAPTPAACTVTRSTAPAGLIGITYVGVGSIMNTTAFDDAAMQDFTCSRIAVLSPSTAYSISVGVSPVNSQWVRAYIDYNRDGDFTDAGENIFAPANGDGTLTGTFTTPAAPVTGQLLRMRVITDFLNTTPGPCTTPLQYGQVEDYGIFFNVPPNTAPVLNTASSPLMGAVLEDAPAPTGVVGTLVSDLADLTVPAGGRDNVTDPDAGAVTGMAVIATAGTGTWYYTINNGTTWQLMGSPSNTAARLLASDANTRLYFQPAANFNGVIPTAITFRAWDRTTGTNGGTADASVNGGTTAFSTATDGVQQAVTAVNDAPVLSAAASPVFAGVNEDAPLPVGTVGTPITSLLDLNPPAGGYDNVTDVDDTPVTGIAVVAANSTNGTWYFSINNGSTWSLLGTPSAAASRLLASDISTRLYFLPAANFNGTVTDAITFRAWDRTSGTNGTTVSTTSNGGTTPYSAATDEAAITVAAVNDAPTLSTPGAQTVAGNTTLAFSAGNGNAISTADVDAGSAAVYLLMSVSNGTLSLSSTVGLTFLQGDGTGDPVQEFIGSLSAVNTALTGMSYTPTTNYSGADALQLTLNDQGNSGSGGALGASATVNITVQAAAVQLALRGMLEGPFNTGTGLMNDGLRVLASFPLTQPYGAAPWNYSGTESVAPAVLAVTGSNAIVDWVLVELRAAANNTTVVATRAGLLQRDGDVVSADGVTPLSFSAAPGNYHVALHHRNHLPVMSASVIALSGSPSSLDLSLAATSTFGTDARRAIGAVQALWAGDVLSDGVLRYTGPSNDRDPMLVTIGGSVPTNTVTGYVAADVNLDGVVRYVGAANDRDIVLQNIGGSVPTNTRTAQLP